MNPRWDSCCLREGWPNVINHSRCAAIIFHEASARLIDPVARADLPPPRTIAETELVIEQFAHIATRNAIRA